MTKKILSLLVCLSLLLSMIVMPSFAEEAAPETEAAPATMEEFDIVGEWIWGEDIYKLGADVVVDRCASNGVTDIYLLTKGTGGTLGYISEAYPESVTRTDVDVLQETITAAHAAGIRVHAWLVTVEDALYKQNNPDAGMWHYVRARDNNRITPYDEGYVAYMSGIATEIATNYEVDGIHLDYIRYNHACNGWSEQDFAALEAMGANIENVRFLIEKTFYGTETEAIDDQYIFEAYRNGDPDALLIAEYRRSNVVALATAIKEAALAANPDIIFSGAIMPEGIYDEAFSDIHYGQNYEDTAALYDYVVPMAYSATYGYSSEDMATMVEQCIEKGNKVVMGMQSYYPTKSEQLQNDIEAMRALLPNEEFLGICHFRHSQFGYAKFTYNLTAGKMTLDVINTNDAGYKWIIVEAAEGVKLTGATLGEGLAADAPITIAEDGSSMTIGYEESAAEWLMEGQAEGSVEITFEGEPTDPAARIAYARIYITNESRSYNNYVREYSVTFVDADGKEIETQSVAAGEAATAPTYPLKPGYRFMGWDVDFSNVTSDLTVAPTYREVAPVENYGDFEIVGEWIHGSDVASLGADTIVERCAKNGVTDIYLLVKGTGGTLGYTKTQYPENTTREQDVLQEMIDCGHAAGIRIHAWLVTVEDSAYKAANPESGIWHYVRARDNDRINPYDEGYNTYMANIATELATNYEIDGIHLDYIRYNHLANGWSEQDFAALEAMGADINRVKYLINKTFYGDKLSEGEEVDAQYIFNAYRNGDKDALLIAQYRRQNVVALAKNIIDAAKAVNPDLIMSAALMPEGAVTEGNDDIAFADLHYGQNYVDALELYDYVCPMAYTGSYADGSPEWFADIAAYAAELGNKVVMGLQSYYPAKSDNLMAEINAVEALLPNENILGIVHFRHTQFGYIKFNYDNDAGEMEIDVINTNATGYKWIIIELAEGLKATAATIGEGFDAEAPVVISEDGTTVTFGYDPAEAGWLMGGMAEGKLYITYEGEQADPTADIALGRIYITNESRSYNVYNDVTPVAWENPFIDVEEDDWFYGDVEYAYENGIMVGVSDNMFDPNGITTRAMIVATLYRIEGSPSVEGLENPFVDVAEDAWYYDAVVWGVKEGVVAGTSATTFDPDVNVTREQVAAFLYRYAKAEGNEEALAAFPDADKVTPYARAAVAWAVENGIISGTLEGGVAYLDPQGMATRAQTAAILSRYMQK